MTRPIAALALLAVGALSFSPAAAEDVTAYSGAVAQSYGADGFVLVIGEREIAIATGRIAEDNGGYRVAPGDAVTVYAVPTPDFEDAGLLVAEAIYLASTDTLLLVDDPAMRDRVRARREAAEGGAKSDAGFDAYDRNADGIVTTDEYVAARPASVSRAEAVRLFEVISRGDRRMSRREFRDPPARYAVLSKRFRAAD